MSNPFSDLLSTPSGEGKVENPFAGLLSGGQQAKKRVSFRPLLLDAQLRGQLIGDNKDKKTWSRLSQVQAIATPVDVKLDKTNWAFKLDNAMAAITGDRDYLRLQQYGNAHKQTRRNAIDRAAAFIKQVPTLSAGAQLDVLKNSYLIEQNRAKLPTHDESTKVANAAYQLVLNGLVKDMQGAADDPTTQEEVQRRMNLIAGLRPFSEADIRGFMNWLQSSADEELPLDYTLAQEGGAGRFNALDKRSGEYLNRLRQLKQAGGFETDSATGTYLLNAVTRMRDRLLGSRLGLDMGINGNLTEQNLTLLNPNADEGYNLLLTLSSVQTKDEVFNKAPGKAANVAALMAKGMDRSAAVETENLRAYRNIVGGAQFTEILNQASRWTPEQGARLSGIGHATRAVGAFAQDMLLGWRQVARQATDGPIGKSLGKYLGAKDQASQADIDSILDGLVSHARFFGVAKQARKDILNTLSKQDSRLPLLFALEGAKENVSVDALTQITREHFGEAVQTRSDRLNSYLAGDSQEGYTPVHAFSDLVNASGAMFAGGLMEIGANITENPADALAFALGERVENITYGRFQRAGGHVKAALRGLKLKNFFHRKLGLGGGAMAKDVRMGLQQMRHAVEEGHLEIDAQRQKLLNETIARAEAYEEVTRGVTDNETARKFLRSDRRDVAALASNLAGFTDELAGESPWLIQQANDWVEARIGGWENLKGSWQRLRGKLPTNVKDKLGSILDGFGQDVGQRTVKRTLGQDIPGGDVIAHRSQILESIMRQDSPDVIRRMLDDRANKGGDTQNIPGAAKVWKDLDELAKLDEVRRDGRPGAQEAFETKVKDMMEFPLIDELDQSTLLILDNLEQTGKGGLLDSVAQLAHTASGGRLFKHRGSLMDTQSMARKVIDATTQNVADMYGAMMLDNLRKRRLDHTYRYAEAKLRDEISVSETEVAINNAVNAPTLEPHNNLRQIKDELNALQVEHRAALNQPLTSRYNRNSTLLRRHVTDAEINNLIKDAPAIWGTTEAIGNKGWSQLQRKNIRSMLKRRGGLKQENRALRELKQKIENADPAAFGEGSEIYTGTIADLLYEADSVGHFAQLLKAKEAGLERAMRRVARASSVTEGKGGTGVVNADTAKLNREMVVKFMDHLAEAPESKITPDDAAFLKHFFNTIPDSMYQRSIQYIFDKDPPHPEWRATFNSFESLMEVYSAGDVDAVLHEWGHMMLSHVMDNTEIAAAARAFEAAGDIDMAGRERFWAMMDAIADKDPKRRIKKIHQFHRIVTEERDQKFGFYWDSFTEWFARTFSRAVRRHYTENIEFKKALPFPESVVEKWHTTSDWIDAKETVPPELRGLVQRMFDDRQGTRGFRPPDEGHRVEMAHFYKDNYTGIRNRVVDEVRRRYKDKVPPEIRFIMRGPLALDKAELGKIATSIRKMYTWVNDAVSTVEHAGGKDLRKFSFDPAQELRTLEDRIRAEIARPASAEMASDMKRLVDSRLDWNPNGDATHAYNRLRDLGQTFQATRAKEAGVDILTLNAMPFWDQVRALRTLAKDIGSNAAIESDRMARLARVLTYISPEQRSILEAAMQAGGTDLAALAKKFPELDRYMTNVRKTTNDAIVDNVQDWLTEESNLQARLLETAHDKGFISDEVYATMQKAGYSPHMYGMFERPKMVQSPTMRGVRRHLGRPEQGPVAGDTTAGIDGSEMSFSRDLAQWRVRLQESGGRIFDELFPSQEEAVRYIQKNFGEEAAGGLKEDGPGFAFETLIGDKGVLARPIGSYANTLDLLTGKVTEVIDDQGNPTGEVTAEVKVSPEARLERFAQLNKDLHTHSFLESLRETGLFLTADQAEEFGIVRGREGKYGEFAAAYRPLPDDVNRFGNLAGGYVHTRLLSEMNNMHGTYEGLRAIFDGMEDMWKEMGYSDLSNAFLGGLHIFGGKLDEALAAGVKTTQVLMNGGAMVANVVSNVTFSGLAIGSKLFHPGNFNVIRQSLKDIFAPAVRGKASIGKSRRLARKTTLDIPDETYYEAVKEGIIGGSLFERTSDEHMQRAFLRLTKMLDVDAMEARRKMLLDLQSRGVGRGQSRAKLSNIKLELASIEQSMQVAKQGAIMNFAKWAVGTLGFATKNKVGLPNSRLNVFLRELYGKVDDFFKLATYRIARQSEGRKKAAWRVKTFMQDYANVSPVVSHLSKTPLIGALMPSFTHEMARITKNAILYQPLRFMAIAGAAQAFNSVSAMGAGVSEERVRAMEDAMGIQDPLERLIKRSTSIRIFNPHTKNMAFSVDFGDFIMPLFNFTQSYSGIGRIADGMADPRTRNIAESATVAGMKFLGNFVGGRPLTNSLLSLGMNKDQVTGAPIMDQELSNRTAWDWTRGFWHALGKNIIPPQFPGGRHFNDVASSVTAVPDPRTGRPFKQASLGRNLIRALTNIKVRGGPAAAATELLGGVDRYDAVDDKDIIQNLMYQAIASQGTAGLNAVPMYGMDRDRAELWARTMSEADPATREKLRNQLKAMYREEDREVVVGGRKFADNKTRYQEDQWAKTQDKRASLIGQFDDMSIKDQTRVLVGMDLADVNVDTVGDFIEVMTTTKEPKIRWETASDRGALRRAQQEVEAYIRERPEKQGIFSPLLQWLRYAEIKAFRIGERGRVDEALRLYEQGLFNYEGR